jgi:hypothetical protein
VAIVDRKWSALPVPYSMEFPDRARKERYYDPDFYQMEVDLLWPRVWQMACRLEEIPQPNDFVEYQILDQSVVVVRTADLGVQRSRTPAGIAASRSPKVGGPARPDSSARFTGGVTGRTARTPS